MDVVQILLNAGANINFKSESGHDAIHFASEKYHINIVKLLIEFGIDIDPKNIHYASAADQVEMIVLFLDHGIDINCTTQTGNNCLHYAVYNHRYAAAKFLISRGADIDAKGKTEQTPLHLAAYEGQIEIVKLLLENGANPNILDEDDESPLHLAIKSRHNNEKVVKLLIDHGSDINADEASNTVLHLAVKKGYFEVVKYLLEKGANISSFNEDWETPLELAISGKDIETIKILIDYGADFKTKNWAGKSGLDLCRVNQNGKEIMDLILTKMMSSVKEKGTMKKSSKAVQFTLEECLTCNGEREEIFSLYPCGHAKTCEQCCIKLIASFDITPVCPICRSRIDDYKKIYF